MYHLQQVKREKDGFFEKALSAAHDHLGPIDATSKQYKYTFATVDSFSKFVWLYATITTSSEEVIRHLRSWSDVFGFPCRVISDRGSAFTSKVFQEFVVTTTSVLRGIRQIQRINRVIFTIISKLSQEEPAKWFEHTG